jgi:hypothetical protein
MPRVHEYMAEISDLMVTKRLEQVKVYRQLGRHRAVAKVLDELLEEESGSTLVPEVLWERARTARKLDDRATEEDMYARIVSGYPDSEYVDRARRRLTGIRNGAPTPVETDED